MSDKETPKATSPEENGQESILDFEQAKDLTIGQAVRKSEEIEAGVTENDSVLDKYIKQHREEIVAGKFDTVHSTEGGEQAPLISADPSDLSPTSLDDFIKDVRSEETELAQAAATEVELVVEAQPAETPQVTAPAEEVVEESPAPAAGFDQVPLVDPEATPKESFSPTAEAATSQTSESQPVFTSQVRYQWDNEKPFFKRKGVIYTSVALLALLIGGSTIYWGMNRNSGSTTASSSQTSSQSASSSSLTEEESNKKAFDDLYASFFTDSNQTALKNSAFGNLESLKTALDKLQGTAAYDAAKEQYDNLVKQVSAIQTVNGQFTTAAITDGVLDINAQAKSDAVFNEASTGNTEIDKVLNQAIEQGRAQVAQSSAVAAQQAENQAANAVPAAATPATSGTVATQASSGDIQNAGVPGFGLSSVGVNLQRHLSRVPYNQDAINDVNNSAWTFNPGILEKILQTSRERGYITGDNYILEKVNIINGNGYYNLFKPDGTYLFSLNAKTGYFVGNARGNADALDY